ncbi:hypothetical protein C7S20_05725 [Christiangramia fulva]|uniref:tRNA (Guanine-N1)-methyltransferase n=1 Tax=Christiangramia fulva TaxID=2126553 RepID=A0A2R3Z3G4_9FLAO|nr:DUF6730 family protein [Christiangramia fulva]AVR44807.1 hypothetical protein C7S20_05725 [Christiangramia fulva]
MKKLDEIMELMADEMADFKTSLEKLEALSKGLNEMSIPISTAAIDENLQSFLQKQEEANEVKNELLRDINDKLERASLIPNYILVLFGSILILLLSGLGYFIYSSKISEEEKFQIYRTISKSELESYQIFFSENPEIKEDYCNWLEQ